MDLEWFCNSSILKPRLGMYVWKDDEEYERKNCCCCCCYWNSPKYLPLKKGWLGIWFCLDFIFCFPNLHVFVFWTMEVDCPDIIALGIKDSFLYSHGWGKNWSNFVVMKFGSHLILSKDLINPGGLISINNSRKQKINNSRKQKDIRGSWEMFCVLKFFLPNLRGYSEAKTG